MSYHFTTTTERLIIQGCFFLGPTQPCLPPDGRQKNLHSSTVSYVIIVIYRFTHPKAIMQKWLLYSGSVPCTPCYCLDSLNHKQEDEYVRYLKVCCLYCYCSRILEFLFFPSSSSCFKRLVSDSEFKRMSPPLKGCIIYAVGRM